MPPNTEQDMKDHDLLITLNAKVDGLATDIRDLKDGVQSRLTDHERRLGLVERDHVSIGGVENAYIQLKSNTAWINDFKTSWRLVSGAIGIIGTVIGFGGQLIFKYFGWI